jgi:SAM-dependent methyltransferase
MNEDLNSAFETYFPPLGRPRRAALRLTTSTLLRAFRLRKTLFGGRVLVNERIVEDPMVLRWVGEGGRVLDIGCVSSRLPMQLACLGHRVDGLDTRACRIEHPNFRFHRGDVFQWSPAARYDTILLVSVIEHFGLGCYGDLVLPDADRAAVERIAPWLEDGGRLLVSLPFGRAGVTPKHRVYDRARLRHVFGDLEWKRQAYFRRSEECWIPSAPEDVERIPSEGMPPNGVAILEFGPGR